MRRVLEVQSAVSSVHDPPTHTDEFPHPGGVPPSRPPVAPSLQFASLPNASRASPIDGRPAPCCPNALFSPEFVSVNVLSLVELPDFRCEELTE